MGRQNIYTLPNVASVVTPAMLTTLLTFLVQQRGALVDAATREDYFKTRFSSHSVLTEIFRKLQLTGVDQAYSLLLIPQKSHSVPEVVDMTFLPFDMMQAQELAPTLGKAIGIIPEINDRMIINITDLTKANGEFNDISQFQGRVVRDFLCRSYAVSTGNVWLSPTLVSYTAKVYSMIIGGQLARLYGLSGLMQGFIQTLFSLFYVGKMTRPELAPEYMHTHARSLGIYDLNQLEQITAFTQDTLGHKTPQSLEEVCQVIEAQGHGQMTGPNGSRLTRQILNAKFGNWYQDGLTAKIALEYPPYFVYLILLVLSGQRIGLAFSMKNLHLERDGKEVFETLLRSHQLTQGVI